MSKKLKQCCAGMCSKSVKKYDKYCSMHRARLTRHGRLDKANYLEIIFKNSKAVASGCIEWQGYRNEDGYGRRRFRGFKQLVHREVYRLIHNIPMIPFGLIVYHSCDNPPCINPAHLFLGTHKDNCDDKCKKGRQPKGKKHYCYGKFGKEHPSHKSRRITN